MSQETNDNDKWRKNEDGLRAWFHSWRYLFIAIAVAGLIVGFYAEENWRGYHAWNKYKQELTTSGERLDAAAYIPPPAAEEDNFAMTPALAPLFQFVAGTQHWINTNAPSLFKDIRAKYDSAAAQIKSNPPVRNNSWVPERTDLNLWATAFSGSENGDKRKPRLAPAKFTSREAASRVLAGLADIDPLLEELRSASKRSRSRFNLRYEEDNPAGILLPHLAQLKSLCQMLQLRACAELALGKSDDAFQDVSLMLYITDATREEPILISHLVRMAELQLALQPVAEGMGTWSEPQLQGLQRRIQDFDFCSDIKHALKAERTFFGSGVIEYIRRAPNKSKLIEQLDGSGTDCGPVGLLLAAAPSGWLYFEQLTMSQAYDQYFLPSIDLDHRMVSPQTVRIAEDNLGRLNSDSPVKRFIHHRYFSAMLVPAVFKVAQKAAYGQTAADTASLACALERYRLAHRQLPDSLEKLAPQFMALLPHDLITGNSLIYRPAPDGHYVLYSVGWNETDEGGIPGKTKGSEGDHRDGDWVWTDNF